MASPLAFAGTPFDGQTYPVGPVTQSWLRLAKTGIAPVYRSLPFVPVRGSGCKLIGADGEVLYDFLACYGSLFTYDTDHVESVVMELIDSGLPFTSSQNLPNPYAIRLADAIRRWSGYDGYVMMKSAGGMIAESAYSLMFMHGTRMGMADEDKIILIARAAFHGRGRTTQTNATYDKNQYYGKGPRVPGIVVVEYTAEAFEEAFQAFEGHICGVMLEPIQGEAGPKKGGPGAFLAARLLARKAGALFCSDEIQNGLRRTGPKFGYEHFLALEDRPDLVILGKSLGFGMLAHSVMVGTLDAMSVLPPGADGETYGGAPLSSALGLKALDIIESEHVGVKACRLGDHFVHRINSAGIRGVRAENFGAMIRIEFDGISTAQPIYERMACDRALAANMLAKAGHSDPELGVAYLRASIMPLGTTIADIDHVMDNAFLPTATTVSDFAHR